MSPDSPHPQVPAAWRISAQAILLDMDGTLVDSTEVVERQWARFAAQYGLDLARIIAFSHGRLTVDTIAEFLPTGLSVAAVTADFEAAELHEVDGIVEVAGAGSFLRALLACEHAARVAVATSAPRALFRRRMEVAAVPTPSAVVCAEDVQRGKPDPAPYLAAAGLLGVAPRAAVIFEDAEAGLLSARASGGQVVIVGGHDGPATAGLPRVADFTAVHVEPTSGGFIVRGDLLPEAWPWQPVLAGPRVALRPLQEADFPALMAVAADPEIWAQHPQSERWRPPVISRFLQEALASRGGLTISDRASGQIIGCTRFYDHAPHSHVFLGYTYLARSHWGGVTNRELKSLLVEHALQFVPQVRLS